MDPAARYPLGDTIDVRPRHEFRTGHFASAVSCPLGELADQLHRLPDRKQKLWVFGPAEDVSEALAWLSDRGYQSASAHPAAGEFASPDETVSSPWVDGPERARLWGPSPFLEETLREHPELRGGTALDVACGSGRDCCWLALAGFRTVGVDILADALGKGRELARECSRAVRTGGDGRPFVTPTWIEADIEAGWPFPGETFDLLTCIRYLHRPLLPDLARAVRPGGTLIYETFTEKQAEFGKPRRPEYLLAAGELREAFEELGFRTVLYRETCPPGGPALASLHAVKPTAASHKRVDPDTR
jgi:SAM-dependent methyltransferase